MTSTDIALGRRIRVLREGLGMSQDELAQTACFVQTALAIRTCAAPLSPTTPIFSRCSAHAFRSLGR